MAYASSGSRPSLASYLVGRLAAGRLVFTLEEAQAALGTNRGAFLDAPKNCKNAIGF
jgi:hypothetical protein